MQRKRRASRILYNPLERYEPELNTGCWLWTGAITGSGYGIVYPPGGGMMQATHVFHAHFKAPVPKGMVVCHRCDTPACVNPEHLFAGTRSENTRDMVRKGRANQKGRPKPRLRGLQHFRAKLSDDAVVAIWRDRRPYPAIAAEYGVVHSVVCNIKNSQRHTHITRDLEPAAKMPRGHKIRGNLPTTASQ